MTTSPMPLAPCHVIRLSARGRSAIATLCLEGVRAATLASSLFQSASRVPLASLPIGRIVFGRWRLDESGAAEEVVIARRAELRWEIHCHGGTAAVDAVARSLVDAGADEIDGTHWLSEQEMDPIRAAARVQLTRATTRRTAAILLDQCRGALGGELREIAALLDGDAENSRQACHRLQILCRRTPLGLHLIEPWRVVLAGEPNVGKSSLKNALVGYERSIVYPQPGTTRDVVTTLTTLDGWPVELADTAGLRTTSDAIEAAGVSRAQAQLAAADLVVLVCDASRPISNVETARIAAYPHAILVHNKSDLPIDASNTRPPGIATSALAGTGIDELAAAIVARLCGEVPPLAAAVPFTEEQCDTIDHALALAEQGEAAVAAVRLRQVIGDR